MCLIVSGRHGKYIFTQESFYLPCVLNAINEQGTSFLYCKHKHMMKSGDPPDKVGITVCYLEFYGMVSQA